MAHLEFYACELCSTMLLCLASAGMAMTRPTYSGMVMIRLTYEGGLRSKMLLCLAGEGKAKTQGPAPMQVGCVL